MIVSFKLLLYYTILQHRRWPRPVPHPTEGNEDHPQLGALHAYSLQRHSITNAYTRTGSRGIPGPVPVGQYRIMFTAAHPTGALLM